MSFPFPEFLTQVEQDFLREMDHSDIQLIEPTLNPKFHTEQIIRARDVLYFIQS